MSRKERAVSNRSITDEKMKQIEAVPPSWSKAPFTTRRARTLGKKRHRRGWCAIST